MKYQPGLPEKNNNVSHEHPLKEFFVLLVGAVAIFVAALLLLGMFVDRAVSYIDPELEASLFGGFVDEQGLEPTEQEVELQALLDQLGECVNVAYPVVIRVSQSEELNAYAMPGGQIVMMSAMLGKLETENGIAFVLAHELGHFKNRDHLRGMGRSIVVLAVSVLLTGANSDLSALLTPVYSAELAQYSQQRESEADAIALEALNCHYGHVGGATEFFEMVDQSEGSAGKLAHYFSSHPDMKSRIAALKNLAAAQGYSIR